MEEKQIDDKTVNTVHRQTVIVREPMSATNGMGIAGFVLALIAIFIGWIPFLGWVVWFLGLLFSFIGVFKKPRGLAIAGLVISLIGIILLIVFFAGVLGLAGVSSVVN